MIIVKQFLQVRAHRLFFYLLTETFVDTFQGQQLLIIIINNNNNNNNNNNTFILYNNPSYSRIVIGSRL